MAPHRLSPIGQPPRVRAWLPAVCLAAFLLLVGAGRGLAAARVIDDTTGTGMHDSGAFYDLVPTTKNAHKPSGQWNHMTITAKGPKIAIVLNDEKVSEIDLSKFTEGGKRPDGTKHKFGDVKIADFNRPGYFGFQDHGQDCWYKNVKVKTLD